MKLYVTGVSGTGKTSIARKLNAEGIKAVDIDDLSHWENRETGEEVGWEPGSSDEWHESHVWLCDVEVLKKELESAENVVVVGHSSNQDEYINLFDKKFILSCSPETIVTRIEGREDNDFGKDPAEQNRILKWHKQFVPEMISKEGAICIDVEKSLEEVVEEIKSHL